MEVVAALGRTVVVAVLGSELDVVVERRIVVLVVDEVVVVEVDVVAEGTVVVVVVEVVVVVVVAGAVVVVDVASVTAAVVVGEGAVVEVVVGAVVSMVTLVASAIEVGPVLFAESATALAASRAMTVPSEEQVTVTVIEVPDAAEGVKVQPVAVPVFVKSPVPMPETDSENASV